ncbi:hypothetical protein VNO78_00471 [Psophocarpus tetragonolobus]|uniref:Uncharacterized protein n=1 Tax=Psophocarpus tetragonolobus TaxID=3891 RepID=A0AAN9XU56_PSOTE
MEPPCNNILLKFVAFVSIWLSSFSHLSQNNQKLHPTKHTLLPPALRESHRRRFPSLVPFPAFNSNLSPSLH